MSHKFRVNIISQRIFTLRHLDHHPFQELSSPEATVPPKDSRQRDDPFLEDYMTLKRLDDPQPEWDYKRIWHVSPNVAGSVGL